MNFYDILLAKKLGGGGGGDITTEALNVTANGQYIAPQGKAYTPVNVDIKGYKVGEVETPTPIASFTASDAPLKSLTASIVPVQAGSGDPSPTNVRPISGWTEEVITRTGKNLFDKDNFKFIANGYIDGNSLQWTGSKTIREYPADSLSNYWNSPLIDVTPLKEKTITYSGFKSESGVSRGLVDENFNVLTVLGTSGNASRTVDLSRYPTAKYLVLSFIKSNYNFDNAQLELGSTATTYEPYAGTTTTIPFVDGQGQSVTVYGGEIDVINGVVTPCPYYASYNGEQLTGEWISDRDVYSPNTTPTTGAQVVNIGATGTPLSVQPTSIKSLDGENNLWASTGQIEDLEYFEEL